MILFKRASGLRVYYFVLFQSFERKVLKTGRNIDKTHRIKIFGLKFYKITFSSRVSCIFGCFRHIDVWIGRKNPSALILGKTVFRLYSRFGRFSNLEPYNFVKRREWCALPWGPPWWEQCISYGTDVLNMAKVPVVGVWFASLYEVTGLYLNPT